MAKGYFIKPYEQIKNMSKLQEVSIQAQSWLNNDFADVIFFVTKNEHELEVNSLCSSKKDVNQ